MILYKFKENTRVLTPLGTAIVKFAVEYTGSKKYPGMGLLWTVILDENGKEWDFWNKDIHRRTEDLCHS